MPRAARKTADTESRTVCFTVTGEFLTDFGRTRVIEGRWDHGYRTLKEGLHGISHDQVVAILQGDAKLIGDSNAGVDYEPDDAKEYKARLQEMFGGVYITSEGRYLRPYAIVTSWGPEDMRAEERDNTPDSDASYRYSFGKRSGEDLSYRSLFYADDRKRDVLRSVRLTNDQVRDLKLQRAGEHDILFSEMRNYPTTIMGSPPLNDPEAALTAYLAAGRYLREVGYVQSFPPDIFPIRQVTEREEEPTLARTMSGLEKPEDIDVLRRHQLEEGKKGRVQEVEEIRDRIVEAAARVYDTEAPISTRIGALDAMMSAQRMLDEPGRLASLREMVLKQADGDLFDMEVEGVIHRVPRLPFEVWCLNRTSWFHLAPAWKPVAPQGLKMMGDDPYHTDWMLGGEFDLDAWQFAGDGPLNEAAMKAMKEVQKRYFNVEVPVLSGSGSAYGKIVHLGPKEQSAGRGNIVVIKNAGPDYVFAAQEAIENGGAIICENGGAMAHLVTVFRDQDLKIVRVPDARRLYPAGRYATVDCTAGKITLADRGGPMRLANGMLIPGPDDDEGFDGHDIDHL